MRVGIGVDLVLKRVAFDFQKDYPQEASQLRELTAALQQLLPLDVAHPPDLQPITMALDGIAQNLQGIESEEVRRVSRTLQAVQDSLAARKP